MVLTYPEKEKENPVAVVAVIIVAVIGGILPILKVTKTMTQVQVDFFKKKRKKEAISMQQRTKNVRRASRYSTIDHSRGDEQSNSVTIGTGDKNTDDSSRSDDSDERRQRRPQ